MGSIEMTAAMLAKRIREEGPQTVVWHDGGVKEVTAARGNPFGYLLYAPDATVWNVTVSAFITVLESDGAADRPAAPNLRVRIEWTDYRFVLHKHTADLDSVSASLEAIGTLGGEVTEVSVIATGEDEISQLLAALGK